jgi:uncharacterized protein YndB with AHSA1/START domain
MSWSMEGVHESSAAPADVFRYYVDPATWGRWAHNTAWGRADGPLETGSTVRVRVRSYPWTYTVRVRELEPGTRIVTEVRPFGVTITSTYEVTAIPKGSRLHHTITLAGPLERLYTLVRGQYTRMLVVETRAVAELAEGTTQPAGGRSAAAVVAGS